MAPITLAGLTKRYGREPVLRGLDLAVGEGELVSLLGPSGCGKTTTLRCVAGLERPDGGEIRIGNEVVASAEHGRFLPPNRRGVGMVFQSYALWPHMSVYGNVAYPLKVRRVPRDERAGRVAEALELVGMGIYAKRPASALSGGQQQRVALARAIVARPNVLLLDEPLSNLDAKLRVAMRKEIRATHDRTGTTSLYVTHDQAEAIAISDRVVVLADGAIEQAGPPQEIYRRPATRFVAEFVGFDNFLPATTAEIRAPAAAARLDGIDAVVWSDGGAAHGPGARVVVAVRSEDLRVSAAGAAPAAGGPAGVAGTVVSRTYTGDRWEYVVDAAGHPLLVRSPEGEGTPSGLEPGDAAAVHFPPGRVVLLGEQGGGAHSVPVPEEAQEKRGNTWETASL